MPRDPKHPTNEASFRGDYVLANESTLNRAHELVEQHMFNEHKASWHKKVNKRYLELSMLNEPILLSSLIGPREFSVHQQPRSNAMSMLDPSEWLLDEGQEPYALKDGTEARLRILEVRKDQRAESDEIEYLNIRLEVPGEPHSKDIVHFLNIPSRNMDAKQLNQARFDMRSFCQCFEVDTSRPFDPVEDWTGLEGWCILGIRKTDRFGEQNIIKKLITPK